MKNLVLVAFALGACASFQAVADVRSPPCLAGDVCPYNTPGHDDFSYLYKHCNLFTAVGSPIPSGSGGYDACNVYGARDDELRCNGETGTGLFHCPSATYKYGDKSILITGFTTRPGAGIGVMLPVQAHCEQPSGCESFWRPGEHKGTWDCVVVCGGPQTRTRH